MFKEYIKLAKQFDYDYLIKLDSDCVINSLDYIYATEEHLKRSNAPLDRLAQIGTYFASICICGCCQTFTKLGVNTVYNLFGCMNRGANVQEQIMKKRVELGYNEDKVVSVLLEMAPVIRINIDSIPNMKGNLNAFNETDSDYASYTSVAFKPNMFVPTSSWDRTKALAEMKEFVKTKKKTKVIIPQFIGNTRFCNWLFLIAACYAHAKRNNYELQIPNTFELLNKIVPTTEIPLSNTFYIEETYNYTPIPKHITGYISGFFQSSKHFNDYKDEIKELYKELIAEKKMEGVAGIHIRLGDYLEHDWRYKSPDKTFIERALGFLSPHIKRLIIFSDEPEKARKLVESCCIANQFTISCSNDMGEVDEIHDIYFMTACEELIMSCSSFSWWAAYLGENKKVIVDKKWYNDNELIETDIYEDTWIKI